MRVKEAMVSSDTLGTLCLFTTNTRVEPFLKARVSSSRMYFRREELKVCVARLWLLNTGAPLTVQRRNEAIV